MNTGNLKTGSRIINNDISANASKVKAKMKSNIPIPGLGVGVGTKAMKAKVGQAPVKLYEAAATLAMLTGAALEGAGLALNEAIKERKLNVGEARNIVGKLASTGRQSQAGGEAMRSASAARPGGVPLNLPPGVSLATNTILDVAEKAKTVVGDGIEIAAKKSYEVGSQLLDDAVDAVVPVELLDKPYGELNPQLTAKLSAVAANMKAIANDPEAKAAVANLAKAAADMGIDAINAATPNINRLVDRVWVVANNVGAKSVRSALNVGMAMLVTALSEVPVVGGMVVGGLEAGTIFNNVVETGSKAVQGFSQIARDSIDTMSSLSSSIGKSQRSLVAPVQQLKDVYGRYADTVGQASRGLSGVRGGGCRGARRTRRLRQKKVSGQSERARIENRLRKSLKAFFG